MEFDIYTLVLLCISFVVYLFWRDMQEMKLKNEQRERENENRNKEMSKVLTKAFDAIDTLTTHANKLEKTVEKTMEMNKKLMDKVDEQRKAIKAKDEREHFEKTVEKMMDKVEQREQIRVKEALEKAKREKSRCVIC